MTIDTDKLKALALAKDLRFHGRFAAETEEQARLRRFNERNLAADLIDELIAEVERLRADTARLDFMIAEECQIEHIDRIGPPPFYRVHWPREEREMRAWSATPREAIDAAIAAKEPPCSS